MKSRLLSIKFNISQILSNIYFQTVNFLNYYISLFFQRLSQSAGAVLEIGYDLACGIISGWSQVFIMQPFEIVKIRLANQSLNTPEYLGIVDCFKKIKLSQGMAAFYRGTLSPLLGVGPQVALQFASNQFIKRGLLKLRNEKNETTVPPISLAFTSGFLSGIPSALAITPVDLTRIQMQKREGSKQYRGSVDATRKIYNKYGLRGLYLGFYPTLLRQVFALSFYFGVYEQGMRMLDPQGKNSAKAPLEAAFFVGGAAGTASWIVTYPIDYIKTVIQSQSIQNKEYGSATECTLKKYREQGHRTFYKGLGVTILRSFPVNGSGFLIFESMMRFLGRKQSQQSKTAN